MAPTQRARLAPLTLLLTVTLGCSSALDCSTTSCLAPEITVKTARAYPVGAVAELCGRSSRCVSVPVGVPTRDSSGVPLTAEPVLDKRWFGKDIMRGATNVRILSSQGDVLAEGVGSTESVHECCAGTKVTFEG